MQHALITRQQLGLSTDLYELTMAAAYHHAGIADRSATFDLSVRELPSQRGYLVVAGLEQALAYLLDLRFGSEALTALERSGQFRRPFLDYLSGVQFSGSVAAIPEGTVAFPPTPLMRVTAPMVEAQIVETFLLTTVTYQTMIATKASRIVAAAEGRSVVDFSPRRDHGPQAGLLCARAAYIGGCIGSSNVLAGDRFGIDLHGTMAHSLVMSQRNEEDAFRMFCRSYPGNPTLLIDTYDTFDGARTACRVAKELQEDGRQLAAVRIDSGDLLKTSSGVRRILDDAGLQATTIFASGNLDEYKIRRLVKAGAPIDGFGVGTELGTSGDAPSLDSTYKLVEWSDPGGNKVPVIKLSTAKVTLPGCKQVWRRYHEDGSLAGDTIGLVDEDLDGQTLLNPVMRQGELSQELPRLDTIRQRASQQLDRVPAAIRRLRSPDRYAVQTSDALDDLTSALRRRQRARNRS